LSWTVLLIDDDAEMTSLLAGILSARGLRSLVAADGAEAIHRCTTMAIRPSVIVLDLVMPGMDGPAFLEAQRAHPLLAGVPVIVMSGAALPDPLPPGVIAMVPKPVSVAQLIAVIQSACGELRAVRSLAKGS
jgi:CheY-like chemotaxis protein